MAKEERTVKVYDLRTKEDNWLGRVVLTSDGDYHCPIYILQRAW